MDDPVLNRLASALADRYRLDRELGAGGMGTVYLAQDQKHDRKVAIKVLRPELAAVIGAERFPVSFTLSPEYVRSTVGISPCGFEDFANLEVASLRERQGDIRAALSAVRRRSYAYHLTDYLAPHLRQEGRLAALTGDSVGAIRAYRHYLALRSDPEPALRPAVEAARAELAKLERSP